MIYNINHGVFGGPLRNGDLIGVCNVVEHLRRVQNDPMVQFHLTDSAISDTKYTKDFYKFLLKQCNYFTETPGEQNLPWQRVNLWDYRDLSGDLVKIPNNKEMKKKIVVFPLFDAPYNTYRNWTTGLMDFIVTLYAGSEYDDYEKLICCKEELSFYYKGWEYSTDFMANIEHIMDAEVFIGGDTGTSHFAGALDRSPKDLIYYYSSRGLLHTTPFYALKGKGELRTYWLDFEGTKWR